MAHISHDMLHAFTHADKGFFFLMLQLFKKPGTVAREYILEGKRKKYFLPFQYILILGAIATFVAVNLHFFEQTTAALSNNAHYSARQAAFMQKINSWQARYYNFMILLQLPFYALANHLIFKRYKLNFAEQLTLQTFVSAQVTLIAMIVMLLAWLIKTSGGSLISLLGILGAGYQIFAYMQFFREYSFKGFLKALSVNLLGFIFFSIFMGIVLVVYGILSGTFN